MDREHDGGELLVGGHDVEDRELPHPFGMIECQPVRDPPPAIVPGQPEPGESKLLHYLDQVPRHGALGGVEGHRGRGYPALTI